jgi:hypothetical protein
MDATGTVRCSSPWLVFILLFILYIPSQLFQKSLLTVWLIVFTVAIAFVQRSNVET